MSISQTTIATKEAYRAMRRAQRLEGLLAGEDDDDFDDEDDDNDVESIYVRD